MNLDEKVLRIMFYASYEQASWILQISSEVYLV